ncbi:stalk domain-containing protein [Paenibacillus septentrionalis]|uniref:Stalk domain-containing protein n=1 Tax=Paenibacillus septentrionalis TaxID=429342 RepID=A0ABW1UYF0_9BACL
MKKWFAATLASAMLATSILATSVFAESSIEPLNVGKLQDSRLLIPIRYISNQLGAQVVWDNDTKRITVYNDANTIELTVDSQKVLVNDSEITLEVPAKLYYGGSTYVPLRFVSEALGAKVSWNQQTQQATITAANKQIVVVGIAPVQPVPKQAATTARMQQLNDKLNEAIDVSTLTQIRVYFQPYFTDRFINQIIQNKGLLYNYKYTGFAEYMPFYSSSTTADATQSIEIGTNHFRDIVTMERVSTLVFENGTWKVDSVAFRKVETPISP